MEQNKKIGLVTVLYNSEKVLDDFFDSLKRQTYKNFILYIVDNKSPDNSLTVAKELASKNNYKTVIVENDDNYGVAQGNNQGILRALVDGCDYVLLTNNDIILNDNTIEKLLEGTIECNADMSVPKIFLTENNNLWCAGGKLNKRRYVTTHFGYNEPDAPKYSVTKRISYAPTCFMLIKSEIFYEIGLMDEKFFVYYDDTDFVYRTQKAKKRLFYIADASMKHKESVCVGKKSNFFYHYIYRNRIYFVSKHSKVWKLFYLMDLLFNKTIRKYKMRNDLDQYSLIESALEEGYKMGRGK